MRAHTCPSASQPPTPPPTWAAVLHNEFPLLMGLLPWGAMMLGCTPPATLPGSALRTLTRMFDHNANTGRFLTVLVTPRRGR